MKRTVLAIILVFIAWSILDFLIHAVILQASYAATIDLWRPSAEMKMGLNACGGAHFVDCFCFHLQSSLWRKRRHERDEVWHLVRRRSWLRNLLRHANSLLYVSHVVLGGAVVEGAAAGFLVGSVGVVGETDEA
ncbi:MAG TPA: hypothetical protein DIU35_00290 [Candidatus Latescibacteria bacterium]|nr:hypothetical protein [Gemmatimonadota bacterium]HCR15895.1 hypothetical protein [Candidatus Latescibacterota bacterium]